MIAEQGNFYRVTLDDKHSGFVAKTDVTKGGNVAKSTYEPNWQVIPPLLAIDAPTVVEGPSVRISGTATDDKQIKDLYVRVYNQDAKLPPKNLSAPFDTIAAEQGISPVHIRSYLLAADAAIDEALELNGILDDYNNNVIFDCSL